MTQLAKEEPRRAGRWSHGFSWGAAFLIWGPGLVVMLADTDVGSVVTAAQSGAVWGYRMVLPQLVLVPVLFLVQEITVRLGLATGKGHGELIAARFGRGWAILSSVTLYISVVGALLTEFAGVAGVGEMFGVSKWLTVPVAALLLIGVALTGSYRKVERVGIAVGLAELAFLPAMLMAKPSVSQIAASFVHLPMGNRSFLMLLAANVGAVIMPWMIFYQQGAVIDKRLSIREARAAKHDTLAGALLTQAIMIMVIVAVAATVGIAHPGAALTTVRDISNALSPFLGFLGAKVLVGMGLLGAGMVAALVASVAGAWGISEAFGWHHTLNERPNASTAKFYLAYVVSNLVGAVAVLSATSLFSVVIDVEVLNALLLPVVLGFLLALESRALPVADRMRGLHRLLVWVVCLAVIGFGLFMILAIAGIG